MAIVYPKSTISPTKLELLADWLPSRPWAGSGAVEKVTSFRFDDPEGEVGIEAILVRVGELLLHVPLTYRGAPLAGDGEHLITTMQHTELGRRWVYDAVGDPVAIACFARAVRGSRPRRTWSSGTGAPSSAAMSPLSGCVSRRAPRRCRREMRRCSTSRVAG